MTMKLLAVSLLSVVAPAVAAEGGLRGRELSGHHHPTHKVKITITNLAPQFGTCQSPVWVGIHDGRFNMFNQGSRASDGIEAMAEDGDPSGLSDQFAITRGTLWEGTVGGSSICAAESVTLQDELTVPVGAPYFLSYATMVLPSNDAFLANAVPRAYKVLNNNAKPLTPLTIVVMGTEVWDAGTEVNDEVARNTGGLAPNVPGAGVNEWYKIVPHPGFKPKGSHGILDRDAYRNADFTKPGYRMMRIQIEIHEKGVMHAAMDLP